MFLGGEYTFWSLFGMAAALVGWAAYRALIGRPNDGRPRCPRCWYDMTGAPSLTCPECGHDARTPRRQRLRRRRPWRLIDVALLLLMLWYLLEMRYRVRVIGETPRSAMVPTSFLIFRSISHDVPRNLHETLVLRTFHANAPTPRVFGWQVRALAWATYRSVKAEIPRGLNDRRMELLHRLTYHDATARRLWARVMVECPQLTDAMVTDLHYRGDQLQTEDIVNTLWELYQQGRLGKGGNWVPRWMYAPQRIAELSDAALAAESPAALELFPLGAQRIYVRRLEERRLRQAEAILTGAVLDSSFERTYLIRSALCRLQRKRPPLSLVLSTYVDLPNMLVLELRVVDLDWPPVTVPSPVSPDPRREPESLFPQVQFHFQAIATVDTGETTRSDIWRWWVARPNVVPGTLDEQNPWTYFIATDHAPTPCKLRVILISQMDSVIDCQGQWMDLEGILVSNEISLP